METFLTDWSTLWPTLLGAGLILGTLAFTITNDQMSSYIRTAIAAAYRSGLNAALLMEDEALRWARSDEGAKFRKDLANRAYDAMPSAIGPVPVGIIKTFVSRETFEKWVQFAFDEMVELADGLIDEEEIRKIIEEGAS